MARQLAGLGRYADFGVRRHGRGGWVFGVPGIWRGVLILRVYVVGVVRFGAWCVRGIDGKIRFERPTVGLVYFVSRTWDQQSARPVLKAPLEDLFQDLTNTQRRLTRLNSFTNSRYFFVMMFNLVKTFVSSQNFRDWLTQGLATSRDRMSPLQATS